MNGAAGLQNAVQGVQNVNQGRTLGGGGPDVVTLMGHIGLQILNPLIEILFAAALIIFLFGVLNYVRGAGDDRARGDGTRQMLWGLVGMFVMMAAFAIVTLIQGTLGVN